MVGCGSRQSPIVISCEYGNEPSDTTKSVENLHKINNIIFSTRNLRHWEQVSFVDKMYEQQLRINFEFRSDMVLHSNHLSRLYACIHMSWLALTWQSNRARIWRLHADRSESSGNIGSEVLTAIFWDRTPCSPLKVNRRFRETHRFHLQGRIIWTSRFATCFHAGIFKDGAICSSETSVDYQRTTRRYITKDRTPNINLRNFSPQANYTNRAIAACRRSWCQLLSIEGVAWSAQRIPTTVNLGFLDPGTPNITKFNTYEFIGKDGIV
jgi:hypothetical protein